MSAGSHELGLKATREAPRKHPPLRSGVLPLRRPRRVVHKVNPAVGVRSLLWEEADGQEDQTARRRARRSKAGLSTSF